MAGLAGHGRGESRATRARSGMRTGLPDPLDLIRGVTQENSRGST